MGLATRKFALLPAMFFTFVTMQGAWAEDVKVIGTTPHILKQTEQEGFYTGVSQASSEIQLLHVELSAKARKALARRAQAAAEKTHSVPLKKADLPASLQLGMNNVPVLNQGVHGTCITFATTGALDAIIGKKDYISQLCQLQLGAYLQQQGTGANAWNGATYIWVLDQMEQYGIANKSNQHDVGCGGYYHYPTYYSISSDSYMDTAQFQTISEPVFGKVASWSNIPASLSEDSVSGQTLINVKKALNNGNRVIFAVMLPRIDLGNSGAVGKYKTWFAKDTWVLSADILAGASSTTDAHALIITGYDDNAIATDPDGVAHQGLFTLRNSWGWLYGDWGDFYMSYDYFQLLAYDVKQIAPYQS